MFNLQCPQIMNLNCPKIFWFCPIVDQRKLSDEMRKSKYFSWNRMAENIVVFKKTPFHNGFSHIAHCAEHVYDTTVWLLWHMFFSTHGSSSTGNPLSINFPLFLHGISDGLSAFVLRPTEPGVKGVNCPAPPPSVLAGTYTKALSSKGIVYIWAPPP